MNTIEKIYTNYDGLLEEFSEEVIQSRYAVFYEEIEEFAKSLGIREKIPDQRVAVEPCSAGLFHGYFPPETFSSGKAYQFIESDLL